MLVSGDFFNTWTWDYLYDNATTLQNAYNLFVCVFPCWRCLLISGVTSWDQSWDVLYIGAPRWSNLAMETGSFRCHVGLPMATVAMSEECFRMVSLNPKWFIILFHSFPYSNGYFFWSSPVSNATMAATLLPTFLGHSLVTPGLAALPCDGRGAHFGAEIHPLKLRHR